jgi:hypothetical protein
MTTPAPNGGSIEPPHLAAALIQLAEALNARQLAAPEAPTYLQMAALSEQLSGQLHELARMLIATGRDADGDSWADVGAVFGVTRQAAMRRWTS